MPAGSVLLMIILIPLLGGFYIFRTDEKDFSADIKSASVWTAAFAFLMSLILFFSAKENFSFFDIPFSANGISVYMIASTTLLILIGVVIGCDEIKSNVRQFHALSLFLESLLVMLFSTADIFAFYILFELILLTAFVLLGVFSKDSVCASKFFAVLSVGAIFLLCGVVYLAETTGITETDVLIKYAFTEEQRNIIFTMFFIGFAPQAALFPLHIWLPDSYAKPPISVSVIFAGILSKIGVFGMLTILVPLTKSTDPIVQKYIFIGAIITIGYATLAALAHRNVKRITAYISISYSAIIVSGIFSYNVEGIFGAFFNMTVHGFIVSALLVTFRIIENHFGTQNNVSGVSAALPNFSKTASIPMFAVISVPLLPCFVGNFLIISGNFNKHVFLSSILCFLIACSVFYGLKMRHDIFFGESNRKKSKLSNVECLCLYPLVLFVIIAGVIPDKFFCFAKDELFKICRAESES
ncbi:MAG: hypothetical protein LBJ96_02785 [Holosporaceae bacterium]|jgi:NADH-quinone oxidoreductase subunit M|nr:hypothetical protein [Holosporaceae bacterium]